jgi:hypothetical protein
MGTARRSTAQRQQQHNTTTRWLTQWNSHPVPRVAPKLAPHRIEVSTHHDRHAVYTVMLLLLLLRLLLLLYTLLLGVWVNDRRH